MSKLSEQKLKSYFTVSILLFIVSFLLLPTAKMVNNVYYLLTALPALLIIIIKRDKVLSITYGIIGWSVFIGWLLLVSAFEGDIQFAKHCLYVTLFFIVTNQFIDIRIFNAPVFSRTLFWSVVVYVLSSSIFYWITGLYAFGERVLWLPGRMDGPIYTCMWITSCFALALPTWVSQRRFLELGTGFLLAFFLMSFALQSRSGLAALIVVLAMWSVLQTIARRKTGLLIFTLLIFCIGMLWFVAKDIPQIGQLLSRGDALRFEIWGTLIGEWKECGIWLGCGLSHESKHILTGGGGILHPHNIFLALGLYTGLVSLLIFMALMCLAFQQAWRQSNPWGLYLFASLVALNFDGSKLIGNPDELWLLVLLPAALILHRDNQPEGRTLP